MKRFSKILVAVLALCLLVGALALAISANYSGIEGKFVVQGEGYDTWEDAVAAANNTHTIYVNEDWTLETGITLSGETTNVKVNLNGKTVSVAGGSMFFNVHTNAKLTIEGEGTLNSSGAVLIGASSSGTVTVNATGAGIVINNSEAEADNTVLSTFRIYDRSVLNVSGFITVNAYNGKRVVFNVASGQDTQGAAALNITDAKISVPLPSKTPETDTSASTAQIIALSDNIDVKIINSDLEVYYGTIIYTAGTASQKTVSDYKGTDADANAWKDTAAQGIVLDAATINIEAKNSRFFSDYGGYSKKMSASGHNIGAGIMVVTGKIDADFDNCRFYADWRPFTSSGSITGAKVNPHQLTFTDCHFDYSPGDNATSQFFIYGMNYKILGGTWSHGTISAGSFYYLPLENSEGEATGQWIGGYMNNTLVNAAKSFAYTGVTSGWSDSTYVEPDSEKTHDITLVIDGASCNFKSGYFTDADKYNAYFATSDAWRNYLYGSADGSKITATDDYKNVDRTATGTWPMSPLGLNFTTGTVSSVLGTNKKGESNGYVKYTDVTTGGSQYSSISTPSTSGGSIITNDAFVIEFDLATENGNYHKQSLTFQGRARIPRFDVNGTYLGTTNASLADGALEYSPSCTISISATNMISFGGKSVALPTNGDWARVTAIIDFEDTGVLEEIEIDAYTKSGSTYTLVDGQKAKIKATKLTKYDIHVYVDGAYLGTNSYDVSTIGYGGYIPEGYEANFYMDGLRVFFTDTANVVNTTCYDNVRVSKYTDSDNIELGFLDENGAPKASIKDLDHFLVMPDNMELPFIPVAEVDGVQYDNEADALAAITEGSAVKLFKNFESLIEANVSFKLEPNGFTFPGFVSSVYTPVDYVASFGYIKLVPAEASELYTVNYTFNGVTKSQTVAKGTLIPAMEELFPSKVEGNMLISVTGWTLPINVPDDYNFAGNVITATPITETEEMAIVAGGVGYESIEAAIAGANGATIKLLKDITVDATIEVAGVNATIDLNEKTVTAADTVENVFEVTSGSLTISGKGTFANVLTVVNASGASTVLNVNADGATDGIVINHRTIADGADTDTYISTFYIDGATVNVSGLVTVNAYNGKRVVFNAYNGAPTLNFERAKVVIPLLQRAATSTQPKGYSWFISAGDGIDININDSEVYMIFGQIFHINGKSTSTTVSAYMTDTANKDFSWKDTAAQGISMGTATMTLVAKNSRFFSEFGGYSEAMHASGFNPGASFMSLVGNLNANFDNCTITTDWRGVTANNGISNGKIDKHQLTFVDCDFVSAPKTGATANAFPQFFMYGTNYRILGGTWARGSMSAGSNYYLELKDSEGNPTGQWVGGYMNNVLVDSAKTHYYTGVTGNWSDSTYVERDAITCNVVRVTDGVARTFKAAYFGDLTEYLNTVKAYEGFSYFHNTGDEEKPFPNFNVGGVNGTVTKDGGYVKHYFDAAAGLTAYNNIDGNPTGVDYSTTGAYIWEFDVSTDHGYFATTDINIEARDRHAVFKEDGSYLGYANSAGALNSLNYEATYSLNIAGDTAKFNGKSVKISTEKGDWTRITFVLDIVYGEERTETVPAYVKNSDGTTVSVDGEKTLDIQVVDITGTTMSVYVDGVLLSSYNPVNTSDFFGGALAKDYMANGYVDDLRIKNSATKESSICYDNVVFMPISNTYTSEELGLVGEDGKPVANLAGNMICGTMPKNDEAAPVISVDGVDYTDVAAANAAIKEGSIVELLANIDEAIEINCKDVKFVDNGKSFPGFVSSAYKFVDWTAARNADYSVLADASEIVTITYPEYAGVSGAQTAVIGSLLKAPAEFDAVYKVVDAEAKKINVLSGWTLVDGEDVQIVTASGVAYPVVDTVDAVVVYWKNADGTVILDTDFYFPGEATVLDEFDGEDIAIDYEQNAYYGVARTGWAGIEDVNLAAAGEYTITAVMGKVAPYNFPHLKYNLSLYSNYVVNFYVPQEIEGVTNVVVSTTADGSVSISHFAPGTIDGVPYEKFGYILGIADTEIKTFYLVYNVGEDQISFPIRVGVPSYASIVMDMYDEDTSAKGEATKALIVNMANYATKVLALDENKFDMTAPGAKIYSDIVAAYGDEYLGYYDGLTNERFLAGEDGAENGDLYEAHGVAGLNFKTGTDENAGNAEALTYIDSIGFSFNTFEPAFLIKYSDKAIEKGIQRPNSDGTTGYYEAGIHVYAGCYSPYYTTHWAEKDGKKYYKSADLWASVGENDEIISSGDTSYDYYVLVANNVWAREDRQEWYKVDYIRQNLDIQVYWSYFDSAKPEDSNNGQMTETIGHVYYNLAAYINDMLVKGADANAEYIEAAKALYAYSYVSAAYGQTK